jgi:hypothetical protein
MSRQILCAAVFASLVLGLPGLSAAKDAAAAPPAKPDSFVSLRVEGCSEKCAEFEISIYDNGRLLFNPNNDKNSTHTSLSKNGMRSIYTRVAKYLEDTGALKEPTECTDSKSDAPYAIVRSSQNGQEQKAKWSSGCANQLEKARSLVKVFVNQTGFWRDINHDSRYWEKYWETWEDLGATR